MAYEKGKVTRIRLKKERGMVRVITYSKGARGAERVVGSILANSEDLPKLLVEHETKVLLGLEH